MYNNIIERIIMQNYQTIEKNIWTPFSILNGRVNAMGGDNNLNILNPDIKNTENANNITSRNYDGNCVSTLYFSQENIDMLQYGIKNKVYTVSNGNFLIGRQSDTELKVIMRSIYFQYGKNNFDNVVEQVKELNRLVIEWAVPQIITNIKQHNSYKQDISTMPMPLERAQLTTQKGTRILEIKSFM